MALGRNKFIVNQHRLHQFLNALLAMKTDGVVGLALTTTKQRVGADEIFFGLGHPRLYRLVHKELFPCRRPLWRVDRTPHTRVEPRRAVVRADQLGTAGSSR